MARLTQADLSDLNESFEERTPLELIHWAQEMFGTRLGSIIIDAACRVCGSPYAESE